MPTIWSAVSGVFHLQRLSAEFLLFVLFVLWKRVSPLFLGNACRFHPTCSEYMYVAILTHGFIKGLLLGLKRLARCHPLAEGGLDPVPGVSAQGSIVRTDDPRACRAPARPIGKNGSNVPRS